jgi:hypothetical protein
MDKTVRKYDSLVCRRTSAGGRGGRLAKRLDGAAELSLAAFGSKESPLNVPVRLQRTLVRLPQPENRVPSNWRLRRIASNATAHDQKHGFAGRSRSGECLCALRCLGRVWRSEIQLRPSRLLPVRADPVLPISDNSCKSASTRAIHRMARIGEVEATETADMHGMKFEAVERQRHAVELALAPSWSFDCPICGGIGTLVGQLVEEDLVDRRIGLSRALCLECNLFVSEGAPFLADALCAEQVAERRETILRDFGM